ncbi:MAG: hypothetical protein AAGA62_03005, partial [Bacteroidota bacterium]
MNNVSKSAIGLIAFLLLPLTMVFGQSPEAFKYQAVLRDAANVPLPEQQVGVRISILAGSASGTVVYEEFHRLTTSPIGLINLNVGQGVPILNAFTDIAWEEGDHYLRVEVNQAGGNNYQLVGTSQLLSVPYALFSTDADSARVAGSVELFAGDGITIDGNTITNAKPSLWQLENGVVFVEDNQVGIGITGAAEMPEDADLFVNGNLRVAEDSSLLGVGQVIGAQGISFAANPDRADDVVIANNGRVTFEEEVGINQTFSFVDLNIRNQQGNSTVFQVEDTTGFDIFEISRGRNIGVNRITNNVTLQVRNKDVGDNNIIANFEKANGDNVLQIQDDNDVVVTGDFSVNNGNKNFILDHPLDPANKILAHNAVESPDHVTY